MAKEVRVPGARRWLGWGLIIPPAIDPGLASGGRVDGRRDNQQG
jgi:hypothetical protein